MEQQVIDKVEQVVDRLAFVQAVVAEYDKITGMSNYAKVQERAQGHVPSLGQFTSHQNKILAVARQELNDDLLNVQTLRMIVAEARALMEMYEESFSMLTKIRKTYEIVDAADAFDVDPSSGETKQDYEEGMRVLSEKVATILQSAATCLRLPDDDVS